MPCHTTDYPMYDEALTMVDWNLKFILTKNLCFVKIFILY